MKISTNEAIAAIYYALLQGGYEYTSLERDAAHTAALVQFAHGAPHPFFAKTRQTTCEVYPFWPRAALLETATFYVDTVSACFVDYEGLCQKIISACNVTDEEKNAAFWDWLADFPAALCEVLDSAGFKRYLTWVQEWIQVRNERYECDLAQIERCISICREKYDSPLKNVQILIDPIKCVYSADYHVVGDTFVFSSGRFLEESIIHEYLHHVVHPVVARHQERVLREEREYPDLDASYYAAGRLYAFEEYAVRQLTARALTDDLPNDLSAFMKRFL